MALKPFRQYNETDVINLFSYTGAGDLNAGTLVTPSVGLAVGEGAVPVNFSAEQFDAAVGLSGRVFSPRWGVTANLVANSTAPLGITLMTVRELDENGERLIHNPRKAAEMGVVVKGQAVPVLTRGILHVTGLNGGDVSLLDSNNVPRGVFAHANAGQLTTTAGAVRVGTLLSAVKNGEAVIHFDISF